MTAAGLVCLAVAVATVLAAVMVPPPRPRPRHARTRRQTRDRVDARLAEVDRDLTRRYGGFDAELASHHWTPGALPATGTRQSDEWAADPDRTTRRETWR